MKKLIILILFIIPSIAKADILNRIKNDFGVEGYTFKLNNRFIEKEVFVLDGFEAVASRRNISPTTFNVNNQNIKLYYIVQDDKYFSKLDQAIYEAAKSISLELN